MEPLDISEALSAKYPAFFPEAGSYWSVELPDSWFELMDYLLQELEELRQAMPGGPDNLRVSITQAKLKFGVLRCYINYRLCADDVDEDLNSLVPEMRNTIVSKMHDIINEWEHISYEVCHVCGERKRMNREHRNYGYSRCEDCKHG